MAGVAALGLVLSLSRMSIVGGLVGTVVALALLPRRARGQSVALAAIVVGVVIAAALGIAPASLTKRISSIFHPTSAHVSTAQGDLLRLHIWAARSRRSRRIRSRASGSGISSSGCPNTASRSTRPRKLTTSISSCSPRAACSDSSRSSPSSTATCATFGAASLGTACGSPGRRAPSRLRSSPGRPTSSCVRADQRPGGGRLRPRRRTGRPARDRGPPRDHPHDPQSRRRRPQALGRTDDVLVIRASVPFLGG